MPLTSFTERMVGTAGLASDPRPVRVPDRGAESGAGLMARVLVDPSSRLRGRRLDLRSLDVAVLGVGAQRDGFVGTLRGGVVDGIGAAADGPVVAGFCDLLTRSGDGRRMYYRLLVGGADGRGTDGWFVVEGVKEVRGGIRHAWWETTTLYTRVVQVDARDAAALTLLRPAERAHRLTLVFEHTAPLVVGVLRVRGLVRQASSMRGSVPRFLGGFVRRVRG